MLVMLGGLTVLLTSVTFLRGVCACAAGTGAKSAKASDRLAAIARNIIFASLDITPNASD